jgi:hypothetical protein
MGCVDGRVKVLDAHVEDYRLSLTVPDGDSF